MRALVMARRDLARTLTDYVRPDGSVDGPSGSRIIESALLARLLMSTGLHSVARIRLEHFVRTAVPVGESERVVQAVFLHPNQARSLARRFLAGFRHSTGDRKRVLLATVLALAGMDGYDGRFAAAARHYRGYAVWTEVMLCSAVILHSAERNPADQGFLTEALRTGHKDEVWQGNLLTHVIALHALRTFDPDGALLREGAAALVRTMNPDGGIPFLAAQDIWVSCLAGQALSRAPRAGRAVARIGEFVAARQLTDGGWGYCRSSTQSDVDDTSRCVAFLQTLNPDRYRGAIARGRSYLLQRECPGSGFPTYAPDDPAEPDLTAGAVVSLAPDPAAADAVGRAVDFLLAAQKPNGTFELSWTRSESSVLWHVVEALQAAERRCPQRVAEMRAAIRWAVSRLADTQNEDGGWGQHPDAQSDVVSTSHAVRLLARRDPGRTARAIDHLLASRGTDGHFAAVPDQVGPRPLPYEYPILTDVHVLSALESALLFGYGGAFPELRRAASDTSVPGK